MIFVVVMYVIALVGMGISYRISKEKTKAIFSTISISLKNYLPLVISVFLIVIPMLMLLENDFIINNVDKLNNSIGVFLMGVIGAISYVPAVFAYPLCVNFLEMGIGLKQVTMFIGTVSVISLVSIHIEYKFLGMKVTLKRNILGFIQALCIAYIMGVMFY